MIFYFSGTGNSLYVARNIAASHNEEIISISKEMNLNKEEYNYYLNENEKIIFVYPIYAWAPPKIVLDFISKINLNNYKGNYISSVATCGANIGNGMELLDKKLKEKKLRLDSGFSIAMPNNYMIMGDLESEENIKQIIQKADDRLLDINKLINKKEIVRYDVEQGPMPKVMTSIINPLFNKYAINTKKFYATEDCTGCKICERICPTKCISVDKVPKWGTNCAQCLACINYCPTKAIQYGKSTIDKGRYINPYIGLDERSRR